MLSKAELNFLQHPENMSADYRYVIKNRIKAKVQVMEEEIALLDRAGLLTLHNSVRNLTKNCKVPQNEIAQNNVDFKNEWWTGRDLNPRLPRCERGDHTELIYRPNLGLSEKIALQANLEVSVF